MVNKIVNQIRNKTDFVPEIAIVLGSGLGSFADCVDVNCIIPYGQLDGMPVSTAPSHKGQFVFGTVGDKRVAIMQGRIHLYEGYSEQEIAIPIRVLKALGAKKIILTNAVGGINTSYKTGDFMLIKDHISSFVKSPLVGPNDDKIGPRFQDMTNSYSTEMQSKIKSVANSLGIAIHSGIFVQTLGPQFETPAEINMYRILGADAVGMSTAIEAIVARHCGLEVAGISLITNMASGIEGVELSGEDVTITTQNNESTFKSLLENTIKVI